MKGHTSISMKLPVFGLVAFGLLTVLGARAEDYPYKEAFDKSGAFNATGAVVVDNVNGNVEVRAWDKNEIRISGEKSAKTEGELKAIELTIEQSADRARVKVRLPKRDGAWVGSQIRANVRITISVPATAKLEKITTVNGGVDVAGMSGGVHAESVNGHVKVTALTGSATLSTVNGGIEAHVVALPGGSKLETETTNGGITLALPADVAAKIDATTVNGGLHCDFPIEVSGHFIGRSVHGTIGGGGATVKANTVNGGVKIRKI